MWRKSKMTDTIELFDLKGKRAIVTGGAGYLGQQFAKALLDAGAEVALMDFNRELLNEIIYKLGTNGLTELHCDITNKNTVSAKVSEYGSKGNIDILVNGAAVNPKFEPDKAGKVKNMGAFPNYSLKNWQKSLDVNLTGAFLVTQAVCSYMEKTGQGSIVNIASHYGLVGPDQRIYINEDGNQDFVKPVDYSVTKAGILGFTKAIASYYRGTQIRVNALTPGGVYNDNDAEFVKQYSSRTILDRMAEPNEFRGAILFLCSEASSYMTGANLIIDGGWTAT